MLVNCFNRKKLWEGCILTTIAHAIMVEEYLELANEQSWDGINYNVQDSCGCRGTITFHEKYLVAVFQDINNRKMIEKCIEDGALAVLGTNEKIIENIAKEEALQYVLDDINGKTLPLITTGFWGIGNDIFSKDTYKAVEENGAYIISKHIKDFEENLQALIEYYDINSELVKLIETIYARKVKNPNNTIKLLKHEKEMLMEVYGEELSECKESFQEINILV